MLSYRTFQFLLHCLNLGIGFVNDIVHCCVEVGVSVREIFGHILLISTVTPLVQRVLSGTCSFSHLMRDLICPECYSSSSTIKNSPRIEATENAGFVLLCRVQSCLDSIVRAG